MKYIKENSKRRTSIVQYNKHSAIARVMTESCKKKIISRDDLSVDKQARRTNGKTGDNSEAKKEEGRENKSTIFIWKVGCAGWK